MKPKVMFSDSEKALIVALYREGKTDKEVADILKVPRKTFTDRLKYNSLTATIKKAKEEPNKLVEEALFSRALGRTYVETKTEFLVDSETKKPVKEQVMKTIRTEKLILPDTGACFIWLKNRDPKKWRDKQELQISEGVELLISEKFLPEIEKKKKKRKKKKSVKKK